MTPDQDYQPEQEELFPIAWTRAGIEAVARQVAREEIASLAGLALRRHAEGQGLGSVFAEVVLAQRDAELEHAKPDPEPEAA